MENSTPIDMLKKDHRYVEELFADFASTDVRDYDKKKSIVDDICSNLKAHAAEEEDVFYPEVEKFSDEGARMIAKSRNDHQGMKNFIGKLENMDPQDAGYDTLLKDLEIITKTHVQEEESEVFPYAEKHIADQMGFGMSAKMMAVKVGKMAKEKIT